MDFQLVECQMNFQKSISTLRKLSYSNLLYKKAKFLYNMQILLEYAFSLQGKKFFFFQECNLQLAVCNVCLWWQAKGISSIMTKVKMTKIFICKCDIFLTFDLENFLKFIYSEKASNFAKSPPYFCPMQCQSKVRWRFRKIFLPSQNI